MPTIETQGMPARRGEALRLIAQGYTTAEIADIMGISPNTVQDYRFGILCDGRAKNMCEAIINLIASGMIKVAPMFVICALLFGMDQGARRSTRPYRVNQISSVQTVGRV